MRRVNIYLLNPDPHLSPGCGSVSTFISVCGSGSTFIFWIWIRIHIYLLNVDSDSHLSSYCGSERQEFQRHPKYYLGWQNIFIWLKTFLWFLMWNPESHGSRIVLGSSFWSELPWFQDRLRIQFLIRIPMWFQTRFRILFLIWISKTINMDP